MERKYLFSNLFLIFLSLLIVNDFFLKHYYHNFLTGKLSDFAGLFIFPLFLCAFSDKKRLIYFSCAVAFVLWKSPLSQYLIDVWNAVLPFKIGRVIDYSDLIALVMLPLSFYYQETLQSKKNKSFKFEILYYSIFTISSFSFLATAGTHGNINVYRFEHSKNEVNKALKVLFNLNPNYRVPDSLYKFANEYGVNPDKKINDILLKMSSDSVSFHIYLPNDGNIILWFKFSEEDKHWDTKGCSLLFINVTDQKGLKYLDKNISINEKKRLLEVVQNKVMNKLDTILSKKNRNENSSKF